jgi:hypothetical protein
MRGVSPRARAFRARAFVAGGADPGKKPASTRPATPARRRKCHRRESGDPVGDAWPAGKSCVSGQGAALRNWAPAFAGATSCLIRARMGQRSRLQLAAFSGEGSRPA